MHKVLMTADAIGGVWTYALELARALGGENISVVLAVMGDAPTVLQQREALALANVELVHRPFRLEWMPDPWEDVDDAGAWLLELEARAAPDVIHLNGYCHGALRWRAPSLVVAHSCVLSWWRAVRGGEAPSEWATYQRRVRAGLLAAGAVVAPTHTILAALRAHYAPLPHAHVIHNARTATDFAPAAKEPFIIAAGRLGDPAKNIQALGEAAPGLPWPVKIAGRTSDASGAAPMPPGVELLGHLASAELARLLSRAAIYCFPARYEPFGLSIVEAALAGCALVLGDIATLRELWNGVAIFVPPNDVCALRVALQSLIDDPAARACLGQAARARALAFTPEKQLGDYLALYEALATSPHTPAPIS